MFRSNWTILRDVMLSLAKATVLWNWSVKIHRYMICGVVATSISGCDVCTVCRVPYKCTTEARSCNHRCSVKTIIITYSDYVFVTLRTRHATRMRHIFICGLAGCTYFSILSRKRYGLRKTLLNIKCFMIFSTTFIYNMSHFKKNWVRYHQKCILVLMKLEFSDIVSKNTQIPNFMKIRPVGPELLNADRPIDRLTDMWN
jgi:hypothetical protein